MRSGTFWLAAFAIALGGLVVFLALRFDDALESSTDYLRLSYFVLLALLVSSGVFGWRRLGGRELFRELGSTIKIALAWVAIVAVLVLGYSYRHELGALKDRIVGELMPASPTAAGPRRIAVRAAANGHFYIDARVNGARVRFLIDTGATDIVLSPDDARRVGIDLKRLRFTNVYRTANGTVRGAPVRLRTLVVGPVRFADLPASVNGAPMRGSLLGMTFLRRFKGYAVRNGVLTLDY